MSSFLKICTLEIAQTTVCVLRLWTSDVCVSAGCPSLTDTAGPTWNLGLQSCNPSSSFKIMRHPKSETSGISMGTFSIPPSLSGVKTQECSDQPPCPRRKRDKNVLVAPSAQINFKKLQNLLVATVRRAKRNIMAIWMVYVNGFAENCHEVRCSYGQPLYQWHRESLLVSSWKIFSFWRTLWGKNSFVINFSLSQMLFDFCLYAGLNSGQRVGRVQNVENLLFWKLSNWRLDSLTLVNETRVAVTMTLTLTYVLWLYRVAILEANYHVTQIVSGYGFDVLDLNFYLRALLDHR
jgi:hypothetical protein